VASRDRDPIGELTAEFLKGHGPSSPEDALTVLGLLASSLSSSRAEPVASGPSAPPRTATPFWPARGTDDRHLQLAEARYRALVEQIPAVVFLAALEGGLTDIYVSPQIETLLGFTQKEWTGNPVLWYRQLHPDDRMQLSREFAQACITGRPFRGAVRVFSRDRRLVWVHVEARLVSDAAGRPLFLHGVGFDISDQQRAQETRQQLLMEQEARTEADRQRSRLQEMFTNVPAAIAVLDGPDHTIEYLNPAALRLAGVGPEVIGKPWEEAFPGFPADAWVALERVYVTGEPFVAREWRAFNTRWPHERFFNFSCQPLRDRHGVITSLLTHAVEVTEQRLAQAEAEAASGRASFLAKLSHAVARSLDYQSTLEEVARLVVPDVADWSVVDVLQDNGSLQLAAAVHRDPGKLALARELRERYPPRTDAAQGVGRVARTGRPELVVGVDEAVLTALARDHIHLSLLRRLEMTSYIILPLRGRGRVHGTLTLAHGESGRRYGPADLVMAEEIGQRAALAIENARLYREAHEASRLKDEFLATLSHELRTPLNAIVGWVHLLRQKVGDSPDLNKPLEVIARNAAVQSQLISDILDVSRIIAGKLVVNLQPVDLAGVIEAALDTVRPAAQAKEIRLQPILDASASLVSGDPARLQQVIWNLLANAIKFAPRHGSVQIRLEGVDSQVQVTVADNGPGIDPEFLPFVFERFRQADSSSTRKHGGLGLGLAIVRHLVELHGGTVEARNRNDGTGAVLTLRLPRRSVTGGPGAQADRHPPEPTLWLESTSSLAGVSLLVVDDEADARGLVTAILERSGARVKPVSSAAEALDALGAERFDVLMADLEMPGEDGYSLIRRVRSLPSEQGGLIPAVCLTAYAGAHDRVKVLQAGYSMHVSKPVQPAELVAVVASLTRNGGGRRG
jgi:PAS domain S-box-containing protein